MTDFGQRPAALLSPLPHARRLAVAALLLGAAAAGALILHGHRVLHVYGGGCPGGHTCLLSVARLVRPGWVDPLALGICLVGVALAAGMLVRSSRRFIGAALVAGAAIAGAVVLSAHRVVGAEYSCPHTAGNPCFYHPRPDWVIPTMAGLVVLGLAGASGILAATRRRTT